MTDEIQACHLAPKSDVQFIMEDGLKTAKQLGIDIFEADTFKDEAEELVEENRPSELPKRDEVVFLFPPMECEDPPLGKRGTRKLTVDADKVDNNTECFIASFDKFTDVGSKLAEADAIPDDADTIGERSPEEQAERIAEGYWASMEECGSLENCIEETNERMVVRENLEILCEDGINSDAISK